MVVALEADLESRIVTGTTATTKQDHMDDCVGNVDEDGAVEQKKVNRRQVDSSVSRIVNSLGLCTPISIKYESLFQKLIKAGLDWIKPLQDKLAENAVAVRQEMMQVEDVLKHHQGTGLSKERALL